MNLPPFSPSSSGAIGPRQPFNGLTANPPEGPSYTLVPLTIKAGQLSASTGVNLIGLGMSICQSVVINNTANDIAIYTTVGSQIAWRVAAQGVEIVPVYFSGGALYIDAQISVAQASDITIQFALFNVQQAPASIGSIDTAVTNAPLIVSGGQGSGAQVEITPTGLGPIIFSAQYTPAGAFPALEIADLRALTNIQLIYMYASSSNTGVLYTYMWDSGLATYTIYDSLAAGGSQKWGDNGGVILGGSPDTLRLAFAVSAVGQTLNLTVWGYP